jgi:hypothetical protein
MSKDTITLSTFGMQGRWEDNPAGVKSFIDDQINNIIQMKSEFDAAADECGRKQPEIVLSALMIPKWKNNGEDTKESYTSDSYKRVKNEYIEYLRKKCEEAGIILEDFYDKVATPDEKKYLEKLEALGSTADLIKNRAIINNQGARHLQIDTNTMIVNKKAFYKDTFGAEMQQDGMNASYYDVSGMYVSAHNKVVYTSPNSDFSLKLGVRHNKYVNDNKDNLSRKTPHSNEIYSVCFTGACLDTGLVSLDRKYYQAWNNLWSCYPVELQQQTFRMTKHIITAVNMSWSQGDRKVDYRAELKALKADIKLDENVVTTIDYQAFSYLVKKYTHPNLSDDVRNQLLDISNENFDILAMTSFIRSVIQENDVVLLASLLQTIPKTTNGNKLKADIFKSEEFRLEFKSLLNKSEDLSKVTPKHYQVLAGFFPEGAEYDDDRKNMNQKASNLLDSRRLELKDSLEATKKGIRDAIEAKMSELEQPFKFNKETDYELINSAIDELLLSDYIEESTIESFKGKALVDAQNKVISNKIKNAPSIKDNLQYIEPSIVEKIVSETYSVANVKEKFSPNDMVKLIEYINQDIKKSCQEKFKKSFFDHEDIQKFICALNELAQKTPIDAKREQLVEKMSRALIDAVNNLKSEEFMPEDIGEYLKEHYNRLDNQYSDVKTTYSALLNSPINTVDMVSRIDQKEDGAKELGSVAKKTRR